MVKNRVDIITLGCSKNLVDSERLLKMFVSAGYDVRHDAEKVSGELVVVNTCGFIGDAKEESIEMILQMAEAKKKRKIRKLFVMGCLSERYREELKQEIPEVDKFYGKFDWTDLLADLGSAYDRTQTGRVLTTPHHYAYIKIAEGCNNTCAFCAIPKIRGPYRSVPMEAVLEEANRLAERGVTELIVIAQDTTQYGKDLYGESRLPQLLKALCEIPTVHWVRVLYCYPERITDELLDVMAAEEKIVKYLDIPIQHCDGEILRRMYRPGNETMLRNLIAKIREKMPDVTLRTTLITGFPGETKEQFNALGDFVQDMQFDRLGCFAYSEEEGTDAAEYEDQIDEETREHRAEILMQQQAELHAEKNAAKIGTQMEAVIEGFDPWAGCYFGRTRADAPEIDGKIHIGTKLCELQRACYKLGQQ